MAPHLQELASSHRKHLEHEDTDVEEHADRGTGCCWGDAPSLSTALGTPGVVYAADLCCTFRTVQVYADQTSSTTRRGPALHHRQPQRHIVSIVLLLFSALYSQYSYIDTLSTIWRSVAELLYIGSSRRRDDLQGPQEVFTCTGSERTQRPFGYTPQIKQPLEQSHYISY